MTISSPAIVGKLRIKHLELFRHVCDLHTLRAAAEMSHMTQPAATKLVRELEEIVGATLFVRDQRGMRPTAEGGTLRRHVGVLLADMARMSQELAMVRDGEEGHIRLGVLPSLAPGLLTRSISSMIEKYPRVRFNVQEGSSTELLDAIDKNELDLAFARVIDRSRVDRLNLTHVYSEPFVVVMRRGRAVAQPRTRQRWEDLSRAMWVMPEKGTPMRGMLDQLFVSHRVMCPTPSVECATLEKVADLVAGSDMLGVLPRSFASHGDRGRKLAVLKEDVLSASTSLISRASGDAAPVMGRFVEMVLHAARELQLE